MKNRASDLNKDRRFTVVLESLRSDFRIFGEGLSALREKLDRLSDKVDGIFEMVGKNAENIHIIKTDLKRFDKRISLLEVTSGK